MLERFKEEIAKFLQNERTRMLVMDVDRLIGLLKDRGYGSRDRLLRKLFEEIGEYCEAIEYSNGSTRKVQKFKGIDPKSKLSEEISDVVMVALALARTEGLDISSVLEIIKEKLGWRETEYRESLKEKENDPKQGLQQDNGPEKP